MTGRFTVRLLAVPEEAHLRVADLLGAVFPTLDGAALRQALGHMPLLLTHAASEPAAAALRAALERSGARVLVTQRDELGPALRAVRRV